jgi:hypothetical protein
MAISHAVLKSQIAADSDIQSKLLPQHPLTLHPSPISRWERGWERGINFAGGYFRETCASSEEHLLVITRSGLPPADCLSSRAFEEGVAISHPAD